MSPYIGELGRAQLQARLGDCSSLSDSLISAIQSNQHRLENLEDQQMSFQQIEEEVRQRLQEIEMEVSNMSAALICLLQYYVCYSSTSAAVVHMLW